MKNLNGSENKITVVCVGEKKMRIYTYVRNDYDFMNTKGIRWQQIAHQIGDELNSNKVDDDNLMYNVAWYLKKQKFIPRLQDDTWKSVVLTSFLTYTEPGLNCYITGLIGTGIIVKTLEDAVNAFFEAVYEPKNPLDKACSPKSNYHKIAYHRQLLSQFRKQES